MIDDPKEATRNPTRDPDPAEYGNTSKDPADWVTGDEPMTGAQASYLKTLCEENGERFDPDAHQGGGLRAHRQAEGPHPAPRRRRRQSRHVLNRGPRRRPAACPKRFRLLFGRRSPM